VQLYINSQGRLQNTHGRTGVYDGNVEIMAIAKIDEASLSIYFVSEGQITQSLTVRAGQVVSERNSSLLFSDEI
jgi:hypothetical protein